MKKYKRHQWKWKNSYMAVCKRCGASLEYRRRKGSDIIDEYIVTADGTEVLIKKGVERPQCIGSAR